MKFQHIKKVLLLVLLAGTVTSIQNTKIAERKATDTSTANKQQTANYSKSLALSRYIPNLGFGNVIANFFFLEFLQYFGDEETRKYSGYEQNPDYFATILKHDYNFRDFYLFLSESTTFYAGLPEKAVALMNDGLSRMEENRSSDSYYIWRYKGTNELLFLADSEAARSSFVMAANWAEQSNHPSAVHIEMLSRRTAEFLASDPDSRTAQIDSWSSILTTTSQENIQARAIERIEALGGSVITRNNRIISVQYSATDNPVEEN